MSKFKWQMAKECRRSNTETQTLRLCHFKFGLVSAFGLLNLAFAHSRYSTSNDTPGAVAPVHWRALSFLAGGAGKTIRRANRCFTGEMIMEMTKNNTLTTIMIPLNPNFN